jgi:hypothetical protein
MKHCQNSGISANKNENNLSEILFSLNVHDIKPTMHVIDNHVISCQKRSIKKYKNKFFSSFDLLPNLI